jgi:oligoribonuclease NrnB/cAMP/cGMP phosphodiesterase (DHH superfamily)
MATYVFYHKDCSDGFTAAWAFYKKYGLTGFKYVPLSHGDPLPSLACGDKIFIADFSFDRATLDKLNQQHELFLLDHHKTAQAELAGFKNALFDMGRSGAMICWEYLFPGQAVPALVRYVQDKDLWQWKLPHSREVYAYISTVPYEFAAWDQLAEQLEHHLDKAIEGGTLLRRSDELKIKEIVSHARLIEFAGHTIPVVNCQVLHSEVGNYLLQLYPQAPFSLSWFVNENGKIRASFRSRGDFDVAEIALRFGGGGHKAAAGSFLPEVPGGLR